ncbi:uncharacterized protein LOC143450417 isoform X1 [Clavelina lepadiformis]|uniref:uncharacterized protein LOC143450417 isoform X1 n=2 Tax=Clavelina lepadiformis TaxID=159417 RepID=UPI004043556B
MFAFNGGGDGRRRGCRFASTYRPAVWKCRRTTQSSGLPICLNARLIRPSSPYYGHSLLPRTVSQYIQPTFPITRPVFCYQPPKTPRNRLCPERSVRMPSSAYSLGAGDGVVIQQPKVLKPLILPKKCPNLSVDSGCEVSEADVSSGTDDSDEELEEIYQQIGVDLPKTRSKKEKIRLSLDEFSKKTDELYDQLKFSHIISAEQYKTALSNLFRESRYYFYKLESSAVSEIMSKTKHWETSKVGDVFQHDKLCMAEILTVHLLQLVHAYHEYGYVSLDSTDPLSMTSFYRGEFFLGGATPENCLMHVTSYCYTTMMKMLELSECPHRDQSIFSTCRWPNNSDFEASLVHWTHCIECDPFHSDNRDELDLDLLINGSDDVSSRITGFRSTSSNEIVNASNYLKIFSWSVQFLQNPDLEDENFYLCCQGVKPYLRETEYILQSDAVKYVFGRLVSSKLNFTNPTLEEITTECRPVGRFEELHSFGRKLPLYPVAVGILIDFLRHKRFNRTCF